MMEKKKILSALKGQLESFQEDGIEHILLPKSHVAMTPSSQPVATGAGQSSRDEILNLKKTVDVCQKCPELVKNRNNIVFGAGHVKAQLMFVGEAPGRDEDMQGVPFVGRAGQLLTKMIESIGLQRNQVFIANVLKCRPPQNRNPFPEEIINCEPYLLEQIRIIQPKVICALGSFAAKTLLKVDQPISRLRGQFHDYHGVKLLPTFHPAYLLRNQSEKRKSWNDMKMLRDELSK